MEAFEYAIKKDIRNNPIVREVDEARVREMLRSAAVGAFVVAIVLYSAWQHFELIRYGYRIEQIEQQRADEQQVEPAPAAQHPDAEPARSHRAARREAEAACSRRAEDTFILERVVPSDAPAQSVVARAIEETGHG